MKKLLGLLALAVVSASAFADQDTLKEIHFSNELRQTYTDKNRQTSNGLGASGFKKDNQENTKVRTILGGDLNLVDEGNLGLRFEFQNDQDRSRNPYDAYKADNRIGSYGAYDKSRTWENDIALYKDVTLGSWTSKWELGWKYKATNGKSKYAGHRGTSNEIYVGPAFGINFLGQNFNAKTQLVYFDQSGNKSADNAWEGNDFDRKKVENFLAERDLLLDKDVEYTLIFEDNDKIIGTGSVAGNVLKCMALDDNYQGMGLSNQIVSKLIEYQTEKGRTHLFIFTKPMYKNQMTDFGFKVVAEIEDKVILLDNNINEIKKFTDSVLEKINSVNSQAKNIY